MIKRMEKAREPQFPIYLATGCSELWNRKCHQNGHLSSIFLSGSILGHNRGYNWRLWSWPYWRTADICYSALGIRVRIHQSKSVICRFMHGSSLISAEQQFDVCVVGAGPVGLTVALECEAAGLSVLLVDAGPERVGRMPDDLSDALISDPSAHVPIDLSTRSGLGGTSDVWGGRCMPLDDIDFERRSFVPHSGWPLSSDELGTWHSRAEYYLDCGSRGFVSAMPEWDEAREISCQQIERLSSQPRMGRRFKSKLKNSRSMRVRLGETVRGVELDSQGGSVRSLSFASSKDRAVARHFVLACGGLQVTRILLDLQKRMPGYFNGEEGPLGRFYMGHLPGRIASVVLHDPSAVESFDYNQDEDAYWYRRRFSLSKAIQLDAEILNTVFWLGNPPFHDPSHGSAAASSLYLNLKLPIARMKFFSNSFVSFHRGNGALALKGHLANIAADPKEAVRASAFAIKHQFSRENLKPFFLRNPAGVYSLHYHSEQFPSASNRVRLVQAANGSDRISIDFHYSEEDLRSVVRAHEVLDRALRRSGAGYVKYWQKPEERLEHVRAQACDGYHQIGTTRMNDNDRDGVVDSDCRVHGLRNLYVAGSSVFPTSGQANPTFTAVALAARLADHLRRTQRATYSTV